MRLRTALLFSFVCLTSPPALLAQKEFGFDNRKASGQEYLKPEESLKRMTVAPGWEVKLFAAEPEVINPIAFTIDERGRVWVVECFEYPKRTPKDRMPQDRIKILEDTDGDGKCDKVTVFAEGKDFPKELHFDMASGIEVGHGGVFLGAPPYLMFLRDTDGDGKCDKYEVLLKGFGSQDTHETLNTFQWGPDGRLYGLHGVFTHSEVDGVKMNAAVWRYDVHKKKFEIFAEGTSNPWGMDFDSNGECFLTCCVIPHLFHMSPGGTYKRQVGSSFNPYAYGLLNEICDHTHHKESGWAHAGLLYLDGMGILKEYSGSVIMGSIHGCCIKRDRLRRNGSTFIATHAEDFLVSGDKNFRPINIRWAPDGSILVIDWHDQNPCHQAAPDSWDKKHGRIYRIQPEGLKNPPPGDLNKRTNQQLIEILMEDNTPWWHRTALRLLSERRASVRAEAVILRSSVSAAGWVIDPEVRYLRAFWGLLAIDQVNEERATSLLELPTLPPSSPPFRWRNIPHLRAWSVRWFGETERISEEALKKLTALANAEPSPIVRLQLASTAQRLAAKHDTLPLLQNLMSHKEDATDPVIPLMIWLALEPKLAAGEQGADAPRSPVLDWLKANAAGNPLVTNDIVPRTMRRLIATGKPEDLAACVRFLGDVADVDVQRMALRGLTEALKGRQIEAPAEWENVYCAIRPSEDPEVRRLTEQLPITFRDAKAVVRALAVLTDKEKPKSDRLDAIRNLAVARPVEAVRPLLDVLTKERDEELRRAAATALGGFTAGEIPGAIIGSWKDFPPSVRVECVNALRSRKEWARELLTAVGKGQIPRTDLTDNAILAIRGFNDAGLNEQIEKVWGRYRPTPAELETLIAKMRAFMHEGRGDFERGRKVFEKNCMQCHKFDGKGHEVGPILDGAERSIDYLLINVLDPNRVIGQPYYTRTILLQDGKLLTGLAAGEDGKSVTVKRENNVLEVVQKSDIATMKTEEKSLMPEGLDKNLTPQDLRDLVRFLMANPFITEVRLSEAIRTGPDAFDTALAPEKGEPLKAKGVEWSVPEVGPAGRIPLASASATGQGSHTVRYVYAEVTAPAAMKSRLLLGGDGKVKTWLNGKLVTTIGTAAKEAAPDQHSVEVELAAGVNRLLLKVSSTAKTPALYAGLLDPDRKLSYPGPQK